ncbi:hypothetical protein ACB092_01G283400 [Castanea dentata]
MERLSSRRVGREKENEKFKGPTTVKQTSTHIQADIPQPQLPDPISMQSIEAHMKYPFTFTPFLHYTKN